MLEEIKVDKIQDIYLVEENKKAYYNISKSNSYVEGKQIILGY